MSAGAQFDEWTLQNQQYAFPYHYTPHFQNGVPRIVRSMGWGLEYLCYLGHAKQLIEDLKPDSLLDVGCGDGRLLSELGSVRRRVGVDLSTEAIAFARAFAPGVDFRAMDVGELTEAFDVVSTIEVLEHVPDEFVPGFLRNTAARVAAGGHLVISVPTTVRPRHPKHYRHYSSETLRATVEEHLPGWKIVREDHIFPDTVLGKLLRKACVNRLWTLDVPLLSRIAWRNIWRRRLTSAGEGTHLMMVIRRPL